jgi:hypothetical protein
MEWLAAPETLTTLIAIGRRRCVFGDVALLEARLTTRGSATARWFSRRGARRAVGVSHVIVIVYLPPGSSKVSLSFKVVCANP